MRLEERTLFPGRPGTPNESYEDVSARLDRIVENSPNKTALIFGTVIVTYRELQEMIIELAGSLRKQGVGVECRVGIYMERSIEMIVAIFAILECGAAYVPLDPEAPAGRLAHQINDAVVKLCITQSRIETRVSHLCDTITLPLTRKSIKREYGDTRFTTPPDALAYIMYTSGSTGVPKGVCVTMRNLANHYHSFRQATAISADDICMLFSNYCFDGSVEEIFAPLLSGATLLILESPIIAYDELDSAIIQHSVSFLDFTAGYWNGWLEHLASRKQSVPAVVKNVVIGGEMITANQLLLWTSLCLNPTMLHITYGPTECTVIASHMTVSPGDSGFVPRNGLIGIPLDNYKLYVLDDELSLVPPGKRGQIFVGGHGVTRGYLNANSLTARKFVPDPHSGIPGSRMYETGDVGCITGNGILEFLGRIDAQVKIRGFRIEPGELETTLLSHPQIQTAIVLFEGEEHDRRIVAFAMPRPGEAIMSDELLTYLSDRTPSYMLPTRIHLVKTLPVTSSGKIDRVALLSSSLLLNDNSSPPLEKGSYEGENPMLSFAARIFAEVLGRETVSENENFFRLGGHSLGVLKVLSRVREQLNLRVPIKTMFSAPTPKEFAAELKRLSLQSDTSK